MTNENKQQLAVWWILWAALLVGVAVTYWLFARRPADVSASDSPVWAAAMLPFVASGIVRWVVLPRMRSAQEALPLFILGMSIAEACCFLGIFVFPAHKLELFAVGTLGILQFAPYFARRYFTPDDEHPSF